MRGYTQLTQEERYQIYVLKKGGHNQTVIASLLGRDKSTISRELRRNRGLKGYRPQQAHKMALGRRHDKAQPRISESVWQHVEALLREQWSPEQVAGRIAMEQGISISHEWIYKYIYADRRSVATCTSRCAVRKPGASATAPAAGVARSPISLDR